MRELKADGLLPAETKLRSSKYLNNLIEQDHRYDKGSLIITGQVPVDRWQDLIGVPTLADAKGLCSLPPANDHPRRRPTGSSQDAGRGRLRFSRSRNRGAADLDRFNASKPARHGVEEEAHSQRQSRV